MAIPEDARMLLFFGGIEPYKNVPLLLKAFERACAEGEQLWIVGRSKQEHLRLEIRHLAARIPNVHVVDRYVADEEIQNYMQAADIAVLPYRDGLTSAAAMLSLSFGVPVIAPRIGCFSSILDENSGLLYDAGDPDCALALIDALRAARQIKFDAEVIRTQVRRFRWEDAADRFASALRLSGPDAAPPSS